MSDVPIKVVCRCSNGESCDPCMQRAFDTLLARCKADPACQDRDTVVDDDGIIYPLEVPRKTGREGYQVGATLGFGPKKPAVDDDFSWRKVSERLSKILGSDEALDVLAEKLNNPAA